METRRTWVLDVRICWTVLIAFFSLSLVPADGRAALIGDRLADGSMTADRAAQIESIRLSLEKEVVSRRLADFGLSAEEVAARLPTMSDEQIHQLAGLSRDIAGGSVLEAVAAVLLIVLLVVVIVKLLDKEIIIR